MNTHNAEKAWFQQLKKRTDDLPTQPPSPQSTTPAPQPQSQKKGRGFSDIAGMDGLKQMVTEGFINVLRHPERAEAYGIKPPAMLFYGPAGCGKTFVAEKVAEELGIHFMKIVPDDLACTWVHGTQQKIGELFRKAEKNRGKVEKYASLGLVLFVAIPLPGTGAWTGSLVAAIMDMKFWRAFLSTLIGVLVAGVVMTLISYGVAAIIP